MKKLFLVALTLLLAVAFAVPAGAWESKFEVVLLYDMVWVDTDTEFQRHTFRNLNDDDWNGMQSMINPFGYVGFNIKDENMGFIFNMEPRGQNDRDWVGTEDLAKVRQMFYWWDVNDWFNLTVGQLASKFSRLAPTDVWAPTVQVGGQGESALVVWGMGFGQVFAQRLPQVQGNFKVHENALFQIALIDPDAHTSGSGYYVNRAAPNYEIAGLGAPGALNNAFLESEETTIPRIDLTLQIDWGPFQVSPSLLWHEHNWELDQHFRDLAPGLPNIEDDVTTWIVSLPFMFSRGGFTFETEINYGQNWGNTSIFVHGDSQLAGVAAHSYPGDVYATTKAVYDANGSLHDTDTLGIWAEAKYNVGMFTPGLFFGYQKTENDDLPLAAQQFENDRTLWVLWCGISLNNHLTVTPYIKLGDLGDLDYGDGHIMPGCNDNDLGTINLYGVNFMVVF